MICVGVDAGGSGTHVAVSRDGVPVREMHAERANVTTAGAQAAGAVIVGAVRAVLDGERPDAIYVGAAGAGRAASARALEQLIAAAFPGALIVVGDDATIALRAAIPSGDGAVLIAGTGSVAFAVHGRRGERRGGLGHLAGDEGSGFWIGMQAVKLYGRVLDGRAPADETSARVAELLGVRERDEFIEAVYGTPVQPADIAALAPDILALAGTGNRASTKIVQQAAQELGDLLRATLRAVDLVDASPAVAFAGGLLRENSLLTFLLETRLIGDVAGITILRGGEEPVHGALRLAQALR